MPPKRSVIFRQLVGVDAGLLEEGVRFLVGLVPAGHANRIAAVFLVQFDGVLGDVAEALKGGLGLFDVNAHLAQSLTHHVHAAVAGGLGAAQ